MKGVRVFLMCVMREAAWQLGQDLSSSSGARLSVEVEEKC